LRFDPAQPLSATPPFLRWTLAYGCAIREFDDYFDPDRTDRLLRGARCASDALAEHRVHQGVAVQRGAPGAESVLGFNLAAVLEPLGGEPYLRQQCGGCPANALERVEPQPLAGCVGYLVPAVEHEAEFHRHFDKCCADIPEAAEQFPYASPRWFGLWINPQPTADEVRAQRDLLRRLAQDGSHYLAGLNDYLAALEAHLQYNIPLVVRVYPGGRCEQRKWYVDPHCGRCGATWPEARRQQCRVCRHVGGRQPEQRRLRMGTRPYRPLAEFLGQDGATAFLESLPRPAPS
jgi:hypothetical protein